MSQSDAGSVFTVPSLSNKLFVRQAKTAKGERPFYKSWVNHNNQPTCVVSVDALKNASATPA